MSCLDCNEVHCFLPVVSTCTCLNRSVNAQPDFPRNIRNVPRYISYHSFPPISSYDIVVVSRNRLVVGTYVYVPGRAMIRTYAACFFQIQICTTTDNDSSTGTIFCASITKPVMPDMASKF